MRPAVRGRSAADVLVHEHEQNERLAAENVELRRRLALHKRKQQLCQENQRLRAALGLNDDLKEARADGLGARSNAAIKMGSGALDDSAHIDSDIGDGSDTQTPPASPGDTNLWSSLPQSDPAEPEAGAAHRPTDAARQEGGLNFCFTIGQLPATGAAASALFSLGPSNQTELKSLQQTLGLLPSAEVASGVALVCATFKLLQVWGACPSMQFVYFRHSRSSFPNTHSLALCSWSSTNQHLTLKRRQRQLPTMSELWRCRSCWSVNMVRGFSMKWTAALNTMIRTICG